MAQFYSQIYSLCGWVIRVEILFDMQWVAYYYIHTASWSNNK